MRLVAFCESPMDFKTSSGLIDRVLGEDGPAWVSGSITDYPESVRVWEGDGHGRSFFDLHQFRWYAQWLSIRVPQGHFNGGPGAAGALMARTVFHIVRGLLNRSNATPLDAVILVWDMDTQSTTRRTGLNQARTEARNWASFRIVLGCPDMMREAWVLAGFDAANADEQHRLDELRAELGFQPHIEAHLLTAQDNQAKRSAKRVLRVLTSDDRNREERCWTSTPLDTLQARGTLSGLREYIEEVRSELVPLI